MWAYYFWVSGPTVSVSVMILATLDHEMMSKLSTNV